MTREKAPRVAMWRLDHATKPNNLHDSCYHALKYAYESNLARFAMEWDIAEIRHIRFPGYVGFNHADDYAVLRHELMAPP
jgi:hypothetical protein